MAAVADGAVTDIAEYLVDAQEQRRLYPDTFWAPDEAKLANAKPGDFMKICDNEQRFWTIVVSADATHITARVDNATGARTAATAPASWSRTSAVTRTSTTRPRSRRRTPYATSS